MEPNILYANDKVKKTIDGCTTVEQVCVANRMRCAFDDMFIYGRFAKGGENAQLYARKLMDDYINKMEKVSYGSKRTRSTRKSRNR